jgi:hypothetical protein
MNEIANLNTEAANIANAAMSDAGFQKMLKFKKGIYICDGQEVPLGTQMIAHALAWTKTWIKFQDRQVVERKVYRIAKGEIATDRDELGDLDRKLWAMGINGQPADPWVLQYLVPMEDPATDEVMIFVTSSFGGHRAVADLCSQYARKVQKIEGTGQPLIRLQKTMMPTKNFGDVPRPLFEVISFDAVHERDMHEISQSSIVQTQRDMDDEIPF